jgi:predicted NAD/FAD-dependent oxidoreductase
MSQPQVAVIGAGVAGLSAARKLYDHGVATVLFEAGRRPGGRLCTQIQHDRQFDHGAQYLTPHSRRSAVLFSKWRKDGWIRPWSVLALELPERKKIDTSSWHVAVPCQGSLADRLAAGLDCRTKVTITGVEGELGQRYLTTITEQRLGPFEIVLCALPAEPAYAMLEPFPELASLARQVQTRPCLATMVLFEEEVMVDFEAAYLSKSELAWVCRDASKPERPEEECWVLHATEEWSRKNLNTPVEKVASLMLSAFAALCPVELPPISYCRSHRWRHALADAPLGLPFCYDDQLKIGVAGDWCSASNVDGAYWSGTDLAGAVLKTLGKSADIGAKKKKDPV